MSAQHIGLETQTGFKKRRTGVPPVPEQKGSVFLSKNRSRHLLNVPTQPQHDSFGLQLSADQAKDFPHPRQPRCGVKFQHEGRVVSVQHETGPAIALAVDPAITRRLVIEQTVAARDRGQQSLVPPHGIDSPGFAGVQDAQTNR